MEKEFWKDIKDYEGLYQVSNYARVKSLKYGNERILKAVRGNYGYLFVNLSKDGVYKPFSVHRLVAEVFLNGNKPIDGSIYAVHHINGDKTDNRVENLVIMTHGEHAKIHHTGANHPLYGKHHSEETREKMVISHIGKMTGDENPRSKPVIGVNKTTGEEVNFSCAREAERVLGIANQSISFCCRGKLKSAGGWMWKYA